MVAIAGWSSVHRPSLSVRLSPGLSPRPVEWQPGPEGENATVEGRSSKGLRRGSAALAHSAAPLALEDAGTSCSGTRHVVGAGTRNVGGRGLRRPEGAVQGSPGQRPGFAGVEPTQALKGRTNLGATLSVARDDGESQAGRHVQLACGLLHPGPSASTPRALEGRQEKAQGEAKRSPGLPPTGIASPERAAWQWAVEHHPRGSEGRPYSLG